MTASDNTVGRFKLLLCLVYIRLPGFIPAFLWGPSIVTRLLQFSLLCCVCLRPVSDVPYGVSTLS
jgi:hypothetical protein